MTRRPSRSFAWPLAAAVVLLAACAGQNASPTAPSTVAGASASGVTILGQVASGSSTAVRAASTSSGLTVLVAGTTLSTSVQGNGQFALENVPPGDVSLQFTGPGTDATLTLSGLSAGQQVHITVTVSGSNASMDTEDDQTEGSSARELEGLISSIDVASSQIVVNGTTVSVPATATIRHGSTSVTLAQLQVGERVHVKGAMQGTVLVATDVMLQNSH